MEIAKNEDLKQRKNQKAKICEKLMLENEINWEEIT